MKKIFSFGQTVEEYNFKVINENEARASAGIIDIRINPNQFLFL